jgi:hypothetical protein
MKHTLEVKDIDKLSNTSERYIKRKKSFENKDNSETST